MTTTDRRQSYEAAMRAGAATYADVTEALARPGSAPSSPRPAGCAPHCRPSWTGERSCSSPTGTTPWPGTGPSTTAGTWCCGRPGTRTATPGPLGAQETHDGSTPALLAAVKDVLHQATHGLLRAA